MQDTVAGGAVTADGSLAKGEVIDSVACARDNSESYALYLPSYYTTDRKYPCIFFFDAHARGAMPLRLYKDIAEKYGFVLAGSNISKNGMAWETTHNVANTMVQDVTRRVGIDPKQVYTSGFSGGSRIASLLAITDGGIAGVIGCAAGFPQVQQAIQNRFAYVGIAGNYDFNLPEMEQLDAQLQQMDFAHQLLTFNGIHTWPPAVDMGTALLWMQVNAMRRQLQPVNDMLVIAFRADMEKCIAVAKAGNDALVQHQLLNGLIRALDGLADITAYQKQLAAVNSSAAYTEALALQTRLRQQEPGLQEELTQQFPVQNVAWWTDKIAGLNKQIRTTKPKQASDMYRRVLAYLGFVCYMYTDHALKAGDLNNAENYLQVFKQADPRNPDRAYLQAICYMKKGDKHAAITAINEAASLRYSDVAQLRGETVFLPLHNDAGFIEVENMIVQNYKGYK